MENTPISLHALFGLTTLFKISSSLKSKLTKSDLLVINIGELTKVISLTVSNFLVVELSLLLSF